MDRDIVISESSLPHIPSFTVPITHTPTHLAPSLLDADLSTRLHTYSTVSRLHTILTTMQFSPPVLYDEVSATVHAMYHDHSLNVGLSRAQAWGADYLAANEPLSDMVAAHSAALSASASFTDFVLQRQRLLMPRRMTADSVSSLADRLFHPGDRLPNPGAILLVDLVRFRTDTDILIQFASFGVPILTSPDFVPNATSGNLSATHRQAPLAIAAHVHQACQAGICVVLDPAVAARCIPFRNEITLGVATKKNKISGRPTWNPSLNAARTPPYLNNPDAVAIFKDTWGPIQHPSLQQIITSALILSDRHGPDSVVIWKSDVKGAYTLLRYAPSDVSKMTARLADGTVVVSIFGNFGWAGLVFAFQIVTRFLTVVISVAIHGILYMYVDDAIGISPAATWEADQHAAGECITSLLGPGTEELSKRESTALVADRSIVILGWSISLSTQRVDLADYNRLKTLYRFLSVDISASIDKSDAQALCSLASRYSAVYRELACLLPDINCLLVTWPDRHNVIKIPERARVAISIWVAFLAWHDILARRGAPRGRPLESFRPLPATILLEFDGSLTGIGVRLFNLHQGIETLIVSTAYAFRFSLSQDSTYQNTVELLAVIAGLLHIAHLGHRSTCVHLRGDSKTVLAWASGVKSKFRSTVAKGAVLAFIMISAAFDIVIHPQSTHIPGTVNVACDRLSRGLLPPDTTIPTSDGLIATILELSSPLSNPSSETDFADRMRRITTALDLSQRGPL